MNGKDRFRGTTSRAAARGLVPPREVRGRRSEVSPRALPATRGPRELLGFTPVRPYGRGSQGIFIPPYTRGHGAFGLVCSQTVSVWCDSGMAIGHGPPTQSGAESESESGSESGSMDRVIPPGIFVCKTSTTTRHDFGCRGAGAGAPARVTRFYPGSTLWPDQGRNPLYHLSPQGSSPIHQQVRTSSITPPQLHPAFAPLALRASGR